MSNEVRIPEVIMPSEVTKSMASSQGDAILRAAHGMKITSPVSYRQGDSFLAGAKAVKAKIMDLFAPSLTSAQEAKKAAEKTRKEISALQDAALSVINAADGIVRQKMLAYSKEIERQRQEEERIQREEYNRQLAAAQAAAEAEQKRQAEELRASGQDEMAEALEEAPAPAPLPFVPPVAPNSTPLLVSSHFTKRSKWVFVVTDESKIPREYMIVDTQKLNAMARALKDGTNIPGGYAMDEGSTAVR